MRNNIGFNFFETRTPQDEIAIASLEEKYGLILPNLYKLFACTFKLGEKNFVTMKFKHPNYSRPFTLGQIEYKIKNSTTSIPITGFFDIEQVLSMWANGVKEEFEWQNFQLLFIASLSIGGLYLGINAEKKDRIYMINWDSDRDYELLADNIFEFVRGLKFIEKDLNLPRMGLKFTDLHRKWGSEYWQP